MSSVFADFSHVDSCVVIFHYFNLQFHGGSESTCNVGYLDSTPELGRSLGGGHGKPLQYPCLEILPMDRGAWWATVHGVKKSQTWLSDSACWQSFYMFICQPYNFFDKVSIQAFCPVFNCLFFIVVFWAICVFWMPAFHMYFANIFSQSVLCVFIFLIVFSQSRSF